MTTKRTARASQALLEIPWVELVVEDGTPCEGIKRAEVRKRDDGEIRKKARCQRWASYAFTALDRSPYAITGKYCRIHLVISIEDDPVESARYSRWVGRGTA